MGREKRKGCQGTCIKMHGQSQRGVDQGWEVGMGEGGCWGEMETTVLEQQQKKQ